MPHTPAPWFCYKKDGKYEIISVVNAKVRHVGSANCLQDAWLISYAPKLLYALEALENDMRAMADKHGITEMPDSVRKAAELSIFARELPD